MLEVTDDVIIHGELDRVYDCFWNAELWPRITPHVTRVEMLEDGASRQRFRMHVRSGDREHAVETERRGVRGQSIIYRQRRPPVFLREHRGEWSFSLVEGGVAVRLIHRAVIDEEAARRELGVASGEEAEALIGAALRRNGHTTLIAVKELIEGAAGDRGGS